MASVSAARVSRPVSATAISSAASTIARRAVAIIRISVPNVRDPSGSLRIRFMTSSRRSTRSPC